VATHLQPADPRAVTGNIFLEFIDRAPRFAFLCTLSSLLFAYERAGPLATPTVKNGSEASDWAYAPAGRDANGKPDIKRVRNA
jgi:hypothetical protein